jgi:hypothetical protein
LNVQGIGILTKVANVIDADGNEICQNVSVRAYGKVEC